MGRKLNDLTGRTFGTLTVLCRASGPSTPWLCHCSACGKEKAILSGNLLRDDKSCGCLRDAGTAARMTTHGMSTATEYHIWRTMRDRCIPNSGTRYAAKCITVCPEWQNSFEAFYSYMGPRPAGKSLDRINNFGNYEPGNVRWATAQEQALNRKPRGVATRDLQCDRIL